MDDTIYIGLRVRNISVVKETYSQIDLTQARVDFFTKIHKFIKDPERSDSKYQENLERKEIDIDIQLLSRAQLPD